MLTSASLGSPHGLRCAQPTLRCSPRSNDPHRYFPSSRPDLFRPSTSLASAAIKTWMPGASPGMTALICVVTITLTVVTISVTALCRISLCKGRRSRGCSRLCGASAVPAGGTTHSAPGRLRASSGRHYDRSVGCATGLGQAGAGNARINCVRCCLRKGDRYRSAFSPRPRKPGLKSRAAGESPQVRTAVERRQASASRRVRGRASCTAGWSKRLPAFRFPFLLCQCEPTLSQFVIVGCAP